MYRDLQPENWPEHEKLEEHRLVQAILRDGFGDEPPLCGDDDKIDEVIRPLDMIHVLDADSSQALAIEEIRRGRNLVIQGPPGTGKSQTIANMIAAAVKAGKSVLFVAEKMAALEVVRRRLGNIGLGDMCLELHSNKANKRAVLQDLEGTIGLGQPQIQDVERHSAELETCRQRLNHYLQIIHTPIEPSGVTPYQVVGELVRLRARGTMPPDFRLANPLEWSRTQYQNKLRLLRDLVEHLTVIGVPHQHPWRGVELDAVLPSDVDRVKLKLPGIMARLGRLCEAGRQLAGMLGVSAPSNAVELSQLARLAQRLAAAPPMDRRSIASPVWSEQRQHIEKLVQARIRYAEARSSLEGTVAAAGWDTDLTAARRNLAAYGRSWFRLLHRAYRDAQATLCGILAVQPPKPFEERLAILDGVIQGQNARDFLRSEPAHQLGCQAFGSYWKGEASNWDALLAIARWETETREAKVDPQFRQLCSRLSSMPDVQPVLRQIGGDLKPALAELKDLFASLRLNLQSAFGVAELAAIPLLDLSTRLQQWQVQPEALSRWVGFYVRFGCVQSEGMAELAAEIQDGHTPASEVVARCEMAYYEELIRETFRRYPVLAAFDGESQQQLLCRFRSLDRLRIELARGDVAAAHFDRLPRGDLGDMRVLRHQFQLTRRHMPIRKLLRQAGAAVQATKPVFMMSPISVAQYLEPGAIGFDLLLIDEASQVQPVDALGAVARAKQIVVVGDSKQLPPTRFFSRLFGDDGPDAGDTPDSPPGYLESILGLCCGQGVPQRMLRWHYRSRHHSLIAVSNHEFYDDRLYVVPSPGEPAPGQGLTFHHVMDAVFDRGGSATNRVEARVVADAVMAHAREHPDKSLGVGAFSVAQRDAILDELELLRRSDSSFEHFFATAKPEPFFVKNLENIQGDERDVIFISVGYGKNDSGYMAMNFGPLSNEGGERRLNVLITRARECCSVFSSIHAEDIDLARAQARGARALKTFLKYAETGLLDAGDPTGRDHDSEFERQVARAIEAQGYRVVPQVGVAGFFIDLAVVDPDVPGRYLLGIECDGVNYHRSRSARDRDRLRGEVLQDRGWILHRIWSTDWFHRPEEELRKAMAAVERAKAEWAGRSAIGDRLTEQPLPMPTEIVRAECNGNGCEEHKWSPAQPYVVASFRISTNQEIHDVSPGELARVVLKIIEIEGPIHSEEIARRVTQLWGLRRTGKRIREAVTRAVQSAARSSGILRDGEFYSLRSRPEVPIRDRGEVAVATLRRPEMLPPVEVRKAIAAIAEANLGVTRDEAVTQTARLFGFGATSPQLRQVIGGEIDSLLHQGRLEERNEKLYMIDGEAER